VGSAHHPASDGSGEDGAQSAPHPDFSSARLLSVLRTFLRHPVASGPAVVLVALAVGVSTGLFAYLGALLWPRIEAPDAERLVSLYVGTASEPRGPASFREYELLRGLPGGPRGPLARLAGYSPVGLSVGDGETTRFAWGYAVSAGYFELFGARPLRGRLLQPLDDRPGALPVAVLHPSFWRARLGGDPGVVGRTLQLNGRPVTVVGIAPDGFQGHGHATAFYFPLVHADAFSGTSRSGDPESRWVELLGRLAPGWSLEHASAALTPAARAADAEGALATGPRRIALARADRHDDGWGPDPQLDSARALFACALLFLLLAAASVTNLQLARTAARRREWAIRAALGEPRVRTALRVAGESALACALGALLGMPLAFVLAARLDGWTLTNPGGLGGWSEWSRLVRIDGRAALFALGAALGCASLAVLASLPSVLRSRRPLATARGAAGESAGLGARRALVALQLALSLALCLGGGLLARSLSHATAFEPGYRVAGLHVATLYAPRNLDGGTPARLYARLREEMERVPGVAAASLSHQAPLAGWYRPAQAARGDRPEALREASYDLVTPGYFATLGLPLRAGRALDERDGPESAPAVVIAETLARELWGGAVGAVGRSLVSPGSPHDAWQVAGVVADVRAGAPGSPAPPAIYFPHAQRTHSRMNLLLRSSLPASEVAAQVRAALRRVHPGLAVVELTTGEEARRRLVTPQRMHAELASLFALLGLAVAMVGLFGLLTHAVVAGGRDLAVRMAVGAARRDLLRLVLGNALRLLGAGALLGVALWIPLSRLVRSLLLGVGPMDPATLAAAPAVLALTTLAAAVLPALRAARTDPAAALRGD
jgi:predicted permease